MPAILRLEDVEKYDLAAERCKVNGYMWSIREVATEAEQKFLASGQRVELNAFTSPQFIEWLEGKLTKHLPRRLVPEDDLLEQAYRRALVVAKVNAAIEEAADAADEYASEAKIPKTLRRKLAKKIKEGNKSWDRVLYEMAEEQCTKDSDE
jgi:hypothetical protein